MLPAQLLLAPFVLTIPAYILVFIAEMFPAYDSIFMIIAGLFLLMWATSEATVALCFFFEDWKR